MSRVVATSLIAFVLLTHSRAYAQDSVEPTEGQYELNAEGIAAFKEGQLDKAENLFRASLNLGALNITWLNLGRVLQRQGRCKGAREAFQSALTAPAVPNPTPEQILRKVTEYSLELEECREQRDIVVVVPPTTEDPVTFGESPAPAVKTPGTHYAAWAVVGTGVAGLAGSVIYDVVLTQDIDEFVRKIDNRGFASEAEFLGAKDDLQDQQLLLNVAYTVSGTLLVGGVLLFLFSGSPGESVSVAPLVGPDATGIVLGADW